MLAVVKPRLTLIIAVAALLALGCSDRSRTGDSGGGGDSDTDADTDTDTWDEWEGETGSIHGTVMAPSLSFPIAGALVYTSLTMPDEIPDSAHCEECKDMTAKFWTLTNPDGTFELSGVPALDDWYLVVQKGLFRTVTEFPVGPGNNDAPLDATTLPGENSGDGMKRIPNYAVLLNWYDRSEDLLAKLGMAELGGDGHFVPGTENYDVYNDSETASSAVGDSSMVFQSQDSLNHYHMVFFPCICNTLGTEFVQSHVEMLRNWVSAGGKLYASCWASQWAEFPFPEYIEFTGDDSSYVVGSVSLYDTMGKIEDQQMRDWLAVVAPTENPDSFPFTGAWIAIDGTAEVDDGHGIDEDNGVVKPITWVTDQQQYSGMPMTVTYNWDCGRIFYSVYQVVESTSSVDIRPQEYVLLYLIMEVGVCSGSYPVE
jgi:hypothetical protein